MKTIGIVLLVIWSIAGILTLADKEVSKISYALTWIILMVQIADNYLIT